MGEWDDEICGECQHCIYDEIRDEFVCDNEESDCYGLEMPYTGTCYDYESKK